MPLVLCLPQALQALALPLPLPPLLPLPLLLLLPPYDSRLRP